MPANAGDAISGAGHFQHAHLYILPNFLSAEYTLRVKRKWIHKYVYMDIHTYMAVLCDLSIIYVYSILLQVYV